ncbi:Ribosome biogenesis protein bms1 [Astathelohania contejeani]|uniref:Ribosome biogenesis protein bms1 n=1 Tax=Astathelohania contejeani TaxID=164912 RepID=A0ABQ7I2C6_9MICR|nr:Ribosome biogenesis protein bms1 [Thelohania contejeani]
MVVVNKNPLLDTNEKHLKKKKLEGKLRRTEMRSQPPVQNMEFKDVAPPLVVITGPKGCGKTTILRAIIKRITKRNIADPVGPITVTTPKKPMTFVEVDHELPSLIDAAKTADLAICVIDGSFGLEMELFEFIGLLKVHGMCKIMFVITHLDKVRNYRKVWRDVKKRLWKEVSPGIKTFAIKNYNNIEKEIDGLIRAISIMKFRPLEWKCTHPYVIVDKVICSDKTDYYYGYVRGGILLEKSNVHIPGAGTFTLASFEVVDDPCLPVNKKILSNKKPVIYAPNCDIGESKEDGIFLEIKKSESKEWKKPEIKKELSLFNRRKMIFNDDENKDDSDAEEEDDIKEDDDTLKDINDNVNIEISSDNNDSDVSSNEDLNDISALKSKLKPLFRQEALTEEDYKLKFEASYKEEPTPDNNIFQRMKTNMINKLEVSALQHTKGIPGQYIKISINTIEKINYNPRKLFIIGTLLTGEQGMGVSESRVIMHKWNPQILKTNDPLFVSMGWMRFQTIPLFSLRDPTRNRMLKYTPEGMHCCARFYGPVVPPGTGLAMFRGMEHSSRFRISLTGVLTDVGVKEDVVKKLKLVGYPGTIHHNTATVKQMFTSDLEVNKFQGGLIKTVGGLRGQIKKAIGINGEFRATFEGVISKSDIVFMRCWVPVPVFKVVILMREFVEEFKGLRMIRDIRGKISNYQKDDNKVKHIYKHEENSSDEEDIKLPKYIESKLPIDKRQVINKNLIEIPISPEEEEFIKLKEEVEKKRKMIDNKRKKEYEMTQLKNKKLEEERLREKNNKIKEYANIKKRKGKK